ncbi:hypothetical protein OQA88_4443 [Cercophora sp. LCS_1]
MILSKLSLATATLVLAANAAVVQLFSDRYCKEPAGERNVWDNTCAPTGGFQSYRIVTSATDEHQRLRAYSKNLCLDKVTSCSKAQASEGCYRATNEDGGSNALGSSLIYCGF